MFKNLITAMQFLTIFTVNREHEAEERSLPRSIAYFPVIGFLIGFLLVNADRVLMLVDLPQTITNALLVALSVVITRGLHIDGLADTLDGLMGGRDESSRLAIMKDSRLGTAGALGIFFILFMKYVSLNSLFQGDRTAALLTAPVLARWSQALMIFKSEYGRKDGMGKAFVGKLRASGFTACSLAAIGLTAFVIMRDIRSLVFISWLLSGVLLLTFLARRYLTHRLGGVTGDAIGAVSELNEALVFLLCVIFSTGNQP